MKGRARSVMMEWMRGWAGEESLREREKKNWMRKERRTMSEASNGKEREGRERNEPVETRSGG